MTIRISFRACFFVGLLTVCADAQTRVTLFPVQRDPNLDSTMEWLGHALEYGLERAVVVSLPKNLLWIKCGDPGRKDWIEAARACSCDVAVRVSLGGTTQKTTLHVEIGSLIQASVKRKTIEINEGFPKAWIKSVEQVITEVFKIADPKHKPDWRHLRVATGLDATWSSYEAVMRGRYLMTHHPELRDSVAVMYRRVLVGEPGYFGAHAAMAEWWRAQNSFDSAIDEYRKALAIDSTQSGVFHAIGDIYFYNKDDVKLARDAYRRELAVSPNAALSLIQIGHTYYIQKEYGQAQTYARQALGTRPDAASAHNLLGLCAMALKDSAQALTHFVQAVGADAQEIPARKNLARWYEQAGTYDDARRMYGELIGIDPHDATAHMALANLDYHTGRQRSAVMHYIEAVLYDPDLESGRTNPVQILQYLTHNRKDLKPVMVLIDSMEFELIDLDEPRQEFLYRTVLGYLKLYYVNRVSDAINDLEIAVKLAPSEKRLKYYLGDAFFQIGKYAQAFNYFYEYSPFAESAFDYAKCLQMIGKILIRQNRFEEAQLEILKSLRMYPNAESYLYYGLALRGSQQADAALTALERAVKLYPQYTEAYLELGNTYFALKRYEEALSNLNKAAALDSHRASLHQSLALVYLTKDDLAAAEKEIRTALVMAPRTGEPVAGIHGSFGDILLKQQRFAEARGQYELQLRNDSTAVMAFYRIASTYAAGKDAKNALTWLETAFQNAFTNFGLLDEDKLFDPLRDSKAFNALVGRYRADYNEKLMRKLKVKE